MRVNGYELINRDGTIKEVRYPSLAVNIGDYPKKDKKDTNITDYNADKILYTSYINNKALCRSFSFEAYKSILNYKKSNNKAKISVYKVLNAFIDKERIKNPTANLQYVYQHKKADIKEVFEILGINKKEKVKKVRKDNIKRSIDLIYNFYRNNKFSSFVTLTFNPDDLDSTNYEACYQKVKHWKERLLKKYPFFKCVGVAEQHKKGGYHFHFLTNLEVDSEAIPYKPIKRQRWKSERGYEVIKYPEVEFWNLNNGLFKGDKAVGKDLEHNYNNGPQDTVNYGFVEVKPIDNEVITYMIKDICKYITKGLEDNDHRRVITCGKLQKALKVYVNYEVTDEKPNTEKLIKNVMFEPLSNELVHFYSDKEIKRYYLQDSNRSVYYSTFEVKDINHYFIKLINSLMIDYLNDSFYNDYLKDIQKTFIYENDFIERGLDNEPIL